MGSARLLADITMEVEWEWVVWMEWEVAGPLHVDTTAAGWDKEAGEGPQVVVMVVVMAVAMVVAMVVVMVVVMVAGDPEDLVEAEDDDAKVKDDNRESWSRFSKMSSFRIS